MFAFMVYKLAIVLSELEETTSSKGTLRTFYPAVGKTRSGPSPEGDKSPPCGALGGGRLGFGGGGQGRLSTKAVSAKASPEVRVSGGGPGPRVGPKSICRACAARRRVRRPWWSPVRRRVSGQTQATASGVVLLQGSSPKHREGNLAYLGADEEESDRLGG